MRRAREAYYAATAGGSTTSVRPIPCSVFVNFCSVTAYDVIKLVARWLEACLMHWNFEGKRNRRADLMCAGHVLLAQEPIRHRVSVNIPWIGALSIALNLSLFFKLNTE